MQVYVYLCMPCDHMHVICTFTCMCEVHVCTQCDYMRFLRAYLVGGRAQRSHEMVVRLCRLGAKMLNMTLA